ncbi:MAG: DUF4268 domain-containing protein [Marinifilaceae bacterium]|jgi:hypothetical protein|nr:DUF4268 domain-containing protein [Marinifilaceae bacterium]
MLSKEEAKKLRVDFWTNFKHYSARKGRKMDSWLLKKTGKSGIQLKFHVSSKDAYVMIQIDGKKDERRYEIFASLLKYKKIFDDECGPELIWDRDYFMENHKNISIVYYIYPDFNMFDKKSWNTYYEFFFEKMSILESTFADVKDLL